MKRLVSLLLCLAPFLCLWAQNRTITGKVTDENGLALNGVTVSSKETNEVATTDINGGFRIVIDSRTKHLVFSYVGMTPQTVAIGSAGVLSINMKIAADPLQEVVVTALGISRDKRALGYATQNIKAEDIADRGELNLVNALQGKVAGVDITGASGAAGASANINIRGITSFTGSNQPLFVIDGIPISNDVDRTGNTLYDQQPSNRALDININDIESVNVLKGPAASVLYGSRASAGAIIITTKKGSGGRNKVKVTYNTSYTFQNVYGLPDFQNEYGQGANGLYNPTSTFSYGPRFGSTPTLSNGLLTSTGSVIDYQAYPDNIRDYYETGTIWDNSLSVNGGDKKQNYSFSIGNTDQKGILPNTMLNRTNVTTGFNTSVTDRLTLGGTVMYVASKQRGILQGNGANSALFQLFSVPRSFDLSSYKNNYKNPDGTSNWPLSTTRDNPYFGAYENPLTSDVNRIIGNVKVGYDIASWLNVSYRLGIDAYTDRRKRINAIGSGAVPLGRVIEDNFFRSELNGDLLITAKKSNLFLDKLDATLLVGQNVNNRVYQNITVQGDELGVGGFYNVSNASVFSSSGEVTRRRRLAGYYAQLSLAYNNYLFLELTGRADRSSTLPVSKNTYFYPSVSASFVFTDALDIQSDVLTYGKLRASVAKVGRDADPYQLSNIYSTWAYGNNVAQFVFPYSSIIGFGAGRTIANDNLRPEFTTSYEGGLNLGFFKGRVTLDAAYFYQSSKNQIVAVGIPVSTGYASKVDNIGEMTNKGVELLLTVTPVSTKDLRWDVTANFTRIRNKVVSIGNGITNFPIPGNRFTNAEASIVEGQPYGVIIGNKWRRSPDGQFLINPATGTLLGVVSGQVIADPNRDFTSGLTNSITYKGLFVSFLVDYKQGGEFMSWTAMSFRSLGALEETGVDRENPRIFPGVIETPDGKYVPNNIQISAQSYWNSMGSGTSGGDLGVFDATTFRIRELSMGIDIPGSKLRTKAISGIRISVYGRNLFYYAPNSPNDPEVNSQGAGNIRGLELQSATNARSFGANLRLTL